MKFSIVPIVAIVTKFDKFLLETEKKLEEGEEVDDDKLEELAVVEAEKLFKQHYEKPLLNMQHPPRAVVTLSEGEIAWCAKLHRV